MPTYLPFDPNPRRPSKPPPPRTVDSQFQSAPSYFDFVPASAGAVTVVAIRNLRVQRGGYFNSMRYATMSAIC